MPSAFQRFMRLMTFVYAGGGLAFLLGTPWLNMILLLPPSTERFWSALAASMMAMLAFVSAKAAERPNEVAWVHVHLLSKSVSVIGFLFAFVAVERLPGYLVGAGVDASIWIAVFLLHGKLRNEAR